MRAVVEAAGIANILTKSLGSANPHNVVRATCAGLDSLKDPAMIARMRGKEVADLIGAARNASWRMIGRTPRAGIVKVTLMKSPTGFNRKQGNVVKSLGLLRIRHTVEVKDTPETRGMIHKVRHLVEVE